MSYEKQTFIDNETVLRAEHLNHIEDGISSIENNSIDKNQGSENVGKILVVGADGNFVLTDMPNSVNGDAVGYIDDDKNIILSGLSDGTYTIIYENEDGSYDNIATYVVGGLVQYSIATTLTECIAVSDNPSIINEGETVTLRYTANTGFMFTDTVTVSGASYTWDSATGKLVLNNPTADVSIIITATKSGYTNIIDTVGYKDDTRISSSDGVTEKDMTGYVTTGMFDVPAGSTVRTKGVNFNTTDYASAYVYAYDANTDAFVAAYNTTKVVAGYTFELDEEGNLTLSVVYNHKLRLVGYGSGANLIVTINEEIKE